MSIVRSGSWCGSAILLFFFLSGSVRGQNPDIEVAGELFVDLDAADPSAGTDDWQSYGTLIDFTKVGEPVVIDQDGAPAVSFNSGVTSDAYVGFDPAPAGLVGPDPTRSIEVWVHNPDIASEETLVAWGMRGGPDGTNMAFNYGNHVLYSAVGHWGGQFPDIGWGAVPPPALWHHLAYTYDGTTTRVYQDGFLSNLEYLGPGVINTHPETPIALAVQWVDATHLDFGPRQGTLSIGKVRIHDGVLTPEQILKNYFIERPRFPLPEDVPAILNAPAEDFVNADTAVYSFQLKTSGFPLPTFGLTEPAGAQVSPQGLISYTIPGPAPDSFKVTVTATNPQSSADASWTVTVLKGNQISTAGELFVDLDAHDPSAGTPTWTNAGTLGDFTEVGDPVLVTRHGAPGVSFNEGQTEDAYQSVEMAPDGLVGPDPTRSIEVWAFNPDLSDEEGMVAWGQRGGPDGTNMSFNYGAHPWYGAVTHWGGSDQDLGWPPSLPPAGQWNHLVYTYDGQNTRVYGNGVEAASEGLGPGQINTFGGTPITIGAQVMPGGTPDFGTTKGTLTIGKVRVHDGVLTPAQVLNNYRLERLLFPLPPLPSFSATPDQGDDPLEVTLDATGSTSPNGSISTYSWDFGDAASGEGAIVKHTFSVAGRYTVTLTVTDIRGAVAGTAKQVTVLFRSESISPWTPVDVGETPPLARGGARPAAGGCLEVYGGGKDIIRASDQFLFIYQQLSGDASVTARVNSADLPPNAKLGVMIREDLTPGSRFVSMFLLGTTAAKYSFWRREVAGGLIKAPKNSTQSFALPSAWVRMERQGGDLVGSWSADGVTWNELGRATLAFPGKVLGGIAATAADTKGDYLAVHATLCDLSVVGGIPPPAPPAGLGAAPGDGRVTLDWTDSAEPDLLGYNVYRGTAHGGPYQKINPALVAQSSYLDTGLTNGATYYYVVRALSSAGESGNSAEVSGSPSAAGGAVFRRGDIDANGVVEITDAVKLLGYLFLGGGTPECLEAGDTDNNGVVDITDAVTNLGYQFLGAAPPAAPGPLICGPDPAPPMLGCDKGCGQ